MTPISTAEITLSICIATLNRSRFIGMTLESIIPQLRPDCEVVIVDGGSTDNTEAVVARFCARCDRVSYIRSAVNNGIDKDYDHAVECARGTYCWLLPDDDLLTPEAVTTVLAELSKEYSLVLVNFEIRDFTMSRVVQARMVDVGEDRIYESNEMDLLFNDLIHAIRYIGCVIIRREIWLGRDRQSYYGSWYGYLGVIFQGNLPGKALLIAQPCISYRLGNQHSFSPVMLTVIWVKWPTLVRSMNLPKAIKERVGNLEPWRRVQELLFRRALGQYSLGEYKRLVRPQLRSIHEAVVPFTIAVSPGVLVNTLLLLYYSMGRRNYRGIWSPQLVLEFIRGSRFYYGNLLPFWGRRSSHPA